MQQDNYGSVIFPYTHEKKKRNKSKYRKINWTDITATVN